MAIDTRSVMLLRLAELRHMREEAFTRGATPTIRHLEKMIAKTEEHLREALSRDSEASGASSGDLVAHEGAL